MLTRQLLISQSFLTARPTKASTREDTGDADSFATAQPAPQSTVPTVAGAPTFATAAPYGGNRPSAEYPETFATATPATAGQVSAIALPCCCRAPSSDW